MYDASSFFLDRLSFLGGRSAGGCPEEEEREGGSMMGCCAASAVGFSLVDPRFFRWALAGGRVSEEAEEGGRAAVEVMTGGFAGWPGEDRTGADG